MKAQALQLPTCYVSKWMHVDILSLSERTEIKLHSNDFPF